MALTETVLAKIQEAFSDFFTSNHDSLYEVCLKNFLRDLVSKRISPSYENLDIYLEKNFRSYSNGEEKLTIRTMFFCAMLELCSRTIEAQIYKIDNLLLYYPEFDLDDRDSQLDLPGLLLFRNYLALAFAIQVPRKRIKSFLIPALCRLENLHHVTGGSQKNCVSKRLFIYYRESGQSIQPDALKKWTPAPVEFIPPPVPKVLDPLNPNFESEEIEDDLSILSFPVSEQECDEMDEDIFKEDQV